MAARNVKRLGFIAVLFLVGTMVLPVGAGDGRPITTGSLFKEMINMPALAAFPNPAYRMVQFSSYDHRSRLPGGPDWFANADGFGGEPIPELRGSLAGARCERGR